MRKITLLTLLLSAGCMAQTYIINVTVADVEKHKLIPNQTVVVTGDKISEVKPNAKIPQGATVIDGKGKFLLPGLVDAHVHFFQSGGLYTRPDAIDLTEIKPYDKQIVEGKARMENTLRRYLKNGITTVIDPGASNNYLKLRDKFKGKEFVPNLYMSGPLLTTYQPPIYKDLGEDAPFTLVLTPESARETVRAQAKLSPDFIKIWYIAMAEGLSADQAAQKYLPVIQAIIDESHKHNLRVAVHAMEQLTAKLAVESGCDYLVHSVEDGLLTDDFVKLIKQNKVILCPTLVVHRGYIDTFAQNLEISSHEIAQADPFQLGSLLDLRHLILKDSTLIRQYYNATRSGQTIDKMKAEAEICNSNLKKLVNAGVTIATGTDAGNIGTLHASSYLDEVLAMRKAGMSNWQILEASTLGGAKVLGKQSESGSIGKGKKADMILLDANPTDNLENLTKIHRVIRNGIVMEPDKILPETPEELVQRQLNAYNLRNLDAFLETYSDDVEIYDFPAKLTAKGKDKIRPNYERMFRESPDLHCQLKNRMVFGNVIIDHERVRFMEKDFVEAGAIYHVENGKIAKVYFTP